jgi:Xaa-Pro aminopeptidase
MSVPGGQGPPLRIAALAETLAERELAALLVESESDLRYVSGFTGSNGMAILRASGAEEPPLFLTDFRYETQSAQQVAGAFTRRIVTGELLDAAAEALSAGAGRLGFDDRTMSVARHRRLRELLADPWELVPAAGLVERLRLVKEPGEIEQIHAAARLADEAVQQTLAAGLAGRTEREVAIDLEQRMRRLGADGPSFPTIVASGAHGALPHAEPRDVQIPADVLVTIDWGAVLDGYCSDCTRTYATGEGISAQAREVYGVVLAAQTAAVDAVRAGPNGRELDAVARAVIEGAGHGTHFGHGLGHGVGLDVHEPPRLSRTANEDPIEAGSVVTVEPGIYLPGVLGVRIEDLLVVHEDGATALTGLPKELQIVG